MNYLITIICALALTTAFTACKNDQGSEPVTTPEPAITPAPSITPGPDAKQKEDFDFRTTKWGMSMEEVKKSEPKHPKVETEDSLTYEGVYKNQLTEYNFKFKDDKLYRGGVVYNTRQKSAEDYMNNYEIIKSEMVTAYGEPVLEGDVQTNPDAVIDPDKIAEATCKGDMMHAAQWNLPRSMVVLMMSGTGRDCRVSIIYIDKNKIESIAGQDGSSPIGIDK